MEKAKTIEKRCKRLEVFCHRMYKSEKKKKLLLMLIAAIFVVSASSQTKHALVVPKPFIASAFNQNRIINDSISKAIELYNLGREAYNNQNYDDAAMWFREAIELRNPIAINALGVLYDEGKGVPQSNVEANKWFKKAADYKIDLAK